MDEQATVWSGTSRYPVAFSPRNTLTWVCRDKMAQI